MVNTWKIITASLVIFAAGVMTGAFSVGIANRFSKRKVSEKQVRVERVQPILPQSPVSTSNPSAITPGELPRPYPTSPGLARLEVFRKLDRAMSLTPPQRERIGQLVDETEKRLRDLWSPIAPEAQRTLLQLRRQIDEEVLTPEQRPAFEKFLKSRSNSDRSGSRKPSQGHPN